MVSKKTNEKTNAPKQSEPASYEAAVQELQNLLAQIEAQTVPLDALLATYQRGQFLLEFCRKQLSSLEQQMQTISTEQP